MLQLIQKSKGDYVFVQMMHGFARNVEFIVKNGFTSVTLASKQSEKLYRQLYLHGIRGLAAPGTAALTAGPMASQGGSGWRVGDRTIKIN